MEANIDLLPDEILLRILRCLSCRDLLVVSRVSNRFSSLVSDREIVRYLDLRRVYNCTTEDFKTFFLPRTRCRNVQQINLDHVYWIKLPGFVVKLKNVESLHMAGTPLTFLQLKWILTSCTKLQNLSISWPDDMETDNAKQWVGGFAEVKNLLSELQTLQILIYANPMPLLELLIHCTGLRKLVITNHHARKVFSAPRSFPGKDYTLNFPHLQELIIDHLDGSFPLYLMVGLLRKISEGCQSSAQWGTYWTNTPVYVNFEPLGDEIAVIKKCSRAFLALTPPMWDMLREAGPLYHLEELLVKGQAPRCTNLTSIIRSCPNLKSMNVMYGLNITLDMKKVCEMLPSLERLSICCHPEQGPPKIVEGIATLHHLTHLTVPVCALIESRHQQTCITKPDNLVNIGFKRKRVGVPSTSNLSEIEIAAFNLVFENCPMIKMLEIGFNTSASCSPAKIHWECLENVKKLRRLTHLTLDGIPITNGRFFIEIAQGCTKLEFLRLKHLGPSGKCCYLTPITQALRVCRNLVHLRIEQNYLAPGTALFKSLEECEKLERLFIHSERDVQTLDIPAMESFIGKLTSLVFVFIVGSHTPKDKCAKLTRKYKNLLRPALVVRLRSALWDVFDDKNTETRTTPACHYNEMITFRSWTFDAFT